MTISRSKLLHRLVPVVAVVASLTVAATACSTEPAAGQYLTLFGTRGSGVGQFEGPAGIFVDPAWRIFVTDGRNSRLVRINDMAGTGWTTFGTHGSGINQFRFPWGVFVGPSGQIFVADVHRIVRINNIAGGGWTTFGSPGSEVNQFSGLVGIFVSPTGQIFVADKGNDRIVRIDDMSGAGWITLGTYGSGINQFDGPRDIYVSPAGQIFVRHDGGIVRINDMAGTGWTNLMLNMAWDSEGHRSWVWPTTGAFVTPAGQIFSAEYAGNRIAHFIQPLVPPPPVSPTDSYGGGRPQITPPPPPGRKIIPLSDIDADAGQDMAAAYEGSLGDFLVTRDRFADAPPCQSPRRSTQNYKTSELYSPVWGETPAAYECADGKVYLIGGDGGPTKGYFVGPAKVAFSAPLWRLKLLTVAGKPAIILLPMRRHPGSVQIIVIERFPSSEQPGIMFGAMSADVEHAVSLATLFVTRP